MDAPLLDPPPPDTPKPPLPWTSLRPPSAGGRDFNYAQLFIIIKILKIAIAIVTMIKNGSPKGGTPKRKTPKRRTPKRGAPEGWVGPPSEDRQERERKKRTECGGRGKSAKIWALREHHLSGAPLSEAPLIVIFYCNCQKRL